ncbi:MAG TPA: biopolymer transporter ExbD [Crocinitomix sp.]|nr:biopolymer transporter ExbD [Crocinitomix sp.]
MARRELEEINAGSMADIAFLLLIFFIVTTTMDLEAGIPQTLPMKITVEGIEMPPVHDRDVLSIKVNANDQLLVEDELKEIEDLEQIVTDYFSANMYSETDDKWAQYFTYTKEQCKAEIQKAKARVEEAEANQDPNLLVIKSNLIKWEKRLAVCEAMPDKKYREINETAVIQLKQKAGSSYGNYIAIKNEIGKVINKLRDEKAKELFNGLDYKTILENQDDEDMREKMKILKVLVPEKIIEPPIKN